MAWPQALLCCVILVLHAAGADTGCGVLCSTDNGLGYLLIVLSTFMVD